jgi:hypothetical protein
MKHNGVFPWCLFGVTALVLLAACAPPTGDMEPKAPSAQGQDAEDILASVGERRITVDEFQNRFRATPGRRGDLQ